MPLLWSNDDRSKDNRDLHDMERMYTAEIEALRKRNRDLRDRLLAQHKAMEALGEQLSQVLAGIGETPSEPAHVGESIEALDALDADNHFDERMSADDEYWRDVDRRISEWKDEGGR